MTNKLSIVHLKIDEDVKVNEETGEAEWPYGLNKEEYLQYLLNHTSSVLINVVNMLEQGLRPEVMMDFMAYSTEDEGFKQNVLKVTQAGLKEDYTSFNEIDGQSPEAFANDNVIDFPGPKTSKETVH